MLFLLSPAKNLDFQSPIPQNYREVIEESYVPHFTGVASQLITQLRSLTPQGIASLMKISDNLAKLNATRYLHWQTEHTPENSRIAILAFAGDVYNGLDAYHFNTQTIHWLQKHLCILSGLYGVLKPLDLIQAYRLEMGTPLANVHGNNLYQFWGHQVTEYLCLQIQKQREGTTQVLVNLASQEYFKVVSPKVLGYPVLDCVFEEYRNEQYKVIGIHAKRARGLMVKYAAQNQLQHMEQLKDFDLAGYTFTPNASSTWRYVFRR